MFSHILRVIFILLEVVLLFNLLIVVHELGHFLAARWRGLYIEGFGVWFGKPIWKKTINGVQYSLGSLPFGGYVHEDSPAAKAGLRPGDKILEVDGRPVSRFFGMNDSVVWNIVRSEGASIPFKIERDGKVMTVDVVPVIAETSGWRRKSTRQV